MRLKGRKEITVAEMHYKSQDVSVAGGGGEITHTGRDDDYDVKAPGRFKRG